LRGLLLTVRSGDPSLEEGLRRLIKLRIQWLIGNAPSSIDLRRRVVCSRPSAGPGTPRPAGGSPPPDSAGGHQASSRTGACLRWPSGTRSWATPARCRPPPWSAGSGEAQVGPCRWAGLPRCIPFMRRTRWRSRARTRPRRSSGRHSNDLSQPCCCDTLWRVGRPGRSCRPSQLPAIARLGRFSASAT
jgi:hypothetical protein